MTDPNASRDSLTQQLFGALPPRARAILLYILMFPLAIAVSGMLLQVNVGSLIQETLSKSRKETVDIVSQMLASRVDKLELKLEESNNNTARLREADSQLDKRLSLVERDVEMLKRKQ